MVQSREIDGTQLPGLFSFPTLSRSLPSESAFDESPLSATHPAKHQTSAAPINPRNAFFMRPR
jgi:hypothetical protein